LVYFTAALVPPETGATGASTGLAAGALVEAVNGIAVGADGGACGVDSCDCFCSNAFLKP